MLCFIYTWIKVWFVSTCSRCTIYSAECCAKARRRDCHWRRARGDTHPSPQTWTRMSRRKGLFSMHLVKKYIKVVKKKTLTNTHTRASLWILYLVINIRCPRSPNEGRLRERNAQRLMSQQIMLSTGGPSIMHQWRRSNW